MTQSQPEQGHLDILPYNKVVTVIEKKADLDRALATLAAAGFAETNLFIHHGEEAQKYLDIDGEYHGFFFRLARKYQRLQGTEKRMLDGADEALNAGHYLLGVQTDGSEELQVKARDAIEPFTQHSIYFCGNFTMTILKLGKN